ncbi:MAG TPA: FecR domain-containing protein [Polyangiaceae bacterium]|nr:FecR domain-containing protein [Polyangiaceae bacterium]
MMGSALRKRLPIESLSDVRWAKVERSLFDPRWRRAPRRRAIRPSVSVWTWRTAIGLACATALAWALVAVGWHDSLRSKGGSEPLRVETAATPVHVELGDSALDVGPQSRVRIAGDDARGTVIDLESGRIECEVAPRKGRPPVRVLAGKVEVRVIGTHFVVARSGDAATVDVQHGTVEVTADGLRSYVGGGEHWPPSASAPSVLVEHVPPATAAGATRGPSHAPPPSAMSRATPRERFEAASALEARQPEAALAIYRDLAEQGGGWGANALFAEGRLQADRGYRDSARAFLREYIGRYPSGPNAEDARRLLERFTDSGH